MPSAPRNHCRRWPASTIFCLAVLTAGGPVAAQVDVLQAAERDLLNFAFATQLGSGIYSVGGRRVQIYRLPLNRQLSEPAGGRPGLRLTLPLTIGLFDFDPLDILEGDVPGDLDTFSAASGIELDFRIGDDWHLLPYAEAGRAWDFHGSRHASLYSVALRARRDLQQGGHLVRVNAGTLYSAVDLDGAGGHSSMLRLETGIEARRRLAFAPAGAALDAGPYGLIEWYADRPEAPVEKSRESHSSPIQVELGFSVGTGARLWGMPLPRLGLAWRFGKGLSAYRIVFGAPFR